MWLWDGLESKMMLCLCGHVIRVQLRNLKSFSLANYSEHNFFISEVVVYMDAKAKINKKDIADVCNIRKAYNFSCRDCKYVDRCKEFSKKHKVNEPRELL